MFSSADPLGTGCHLPVVCQMESKGTNLSAAPEIIWTKVRGFLIDPPFLPTYGQPENSVCCLEGDKVVVNQTTTVLLRMQCWLVGKIDACIGEVMGQLYFSFPTW